MKNFLNLDYIHQAFIEILISSHNLEEFYLGQSLIFKDNQKYKN